MATPVFPSGRAHMTMRPARGEKMLGQAAPIANTDTVLYTAPTNIVGVLTAIVVANTGGALTFRVHHNDTGGAAAVGNALYYGPAIGANTTILIGTDSEVGFAVSPGGKIIVHTPGGASITYTAYGYEIPVTE